MEYTLYIDLDLDQWAIMLDGRIVISGSMIDVSEARQAVYELNQGKCEQCEIHEIHENLYKSGKISPVKFPR